MFTIISKFPNETNFISMGIFSNILKQTKVKVVDFFFEEVDSVKADNSNNSKTPQVTQTPAQLPTTSPTASVTSQLPSSSQPAGSSSSTSSSASTSTLSRPPSTQKITKVLFAKEQEQARATFSPSTSVASGMHGPTWDRKALSEYLEQIYAEISEAQSIHQAFVSDSSLYGRKISIKELQIVKTKLDLDISGLVAKQKNLSLDQEAAEVLSLVISEGLRIMGAIEETIKETMGVTA